MNLRVVFLILAVTVMVMFSFFQQFFRMFRLIFGIRLNETPETLPIASTELAPL